MVKTASARTTMRWQHTTKNIGVRPYMFEAMTKKKTGAEDGEVEHGSMGDHRDIGEIGHLQNVEW